MNGPMKRIATMRSTFAGERDGAIILALLVAMVVLGVGAVALTVSGSEMRVASNHARSASAEYFSEGELHRTVGEQNDLTRSLRYLFAPADYAYRATGPNDSSLLLLHDAEAPLSGHTQTVGDVQLQ